MSNKKEIKHKQNTWLHLKSIVMLLLLQYLIDILYIYIYPTVNPIRATLIGATSLLVLFIPWLNKQLQLKPWIAFLPIYSSALFGALLVLAGVLVSKSMLSGIVHALILVVTYAVIMVVMNYKKS